MHAFIWERERKSEIEKKGAKKLNPCISCAAHCATLDICIASQQRRENETGQKKVIILNNLLFPFFSLSNSFSAFFPLLCSHRSPSDIIASFQSGWQRKSVKWKRKAQREWVALKEIKRERAHIFIWFRYKRCASVVDDDFSAVIPWWSTLFFHCDPHSPYTFTIVLVRRAEKNNQLAPILHSHVDSFYTRRSYCVPLSQSH